MAFSMGTCDIDETSKVFWAKNGQMAMDAFWLKQKVQSERQENRAAF